MFSVLTSKIFGALSVVLLVAGVAGYIHMDAKVDTYREAGEILAKRLGTANQNYATARANAATMEAALMACNLGVEKAVADANAAAARAVAQLRRAQAGRDELQRRLDRIDAAPAATCEDAEAILRGDAG